MSDKYINNINDIYSQSKYSNRYGLDLFITISIIFIILILFLYIIINSNLKNIRKNWQENKCNPIYFPFISLINPNPNVSGEKQIEDTVNDCIKNNVNEIASTSINSFYDYYNNFNDSISKSDNWFSNLHNFFDSLKAMLASIMKFIAEKIRNILVGTNTIINSFSNILIKLGAVLYIFINGIKTAMHIALSFVINSVYITSILGLLPGTMALLTVISAIRTITLIIMAIPWILGWLKIPFFIILILDIVMFILFLLWLVLVAVVIAIFNYLISTVLSYL